MKQDNFKIKIFLLSDFLRESRFARIAFMAIFCYLLSDYASATVTDNLQGAVRELQQEVFGNGWITVGKIAAAAVGGVMAIARSSAIPFAMGAGVACGLHFFQKYTESAAACLF